jgi:hypothetical protein
MPLRGAASLSRIMESLQFTALDDTSYQRSTAALVEAISQLQQSGEAVDREQLPWLGIPVPSTESQGASSPDPGLLEPLLRNDEQLRQLQIQLEQDFAPFEQPRYQQLREAVEQYRRLRHARDMRNLRQQFDQHCDRLKELVARWESTGDDRIYEPMRGHILWLDEHLQGPEVVQRLRSELSHPNLIMRLPADALALVSKQSISQSDPFSQRSKQLQTTGTSRFNGTVRLMPHVGETPFELACPGTVQLTTKSHLGPFRFDSRATTRVQARLDLSVTEEGFRLAAAPVIEARTRLQVGQVRARRNGLLPRVASRVVEGAIGRRSGEAAEQISTTIEERLSREMQRLANEQLQQINDGFQRRIADPATRLLMWPRAWQVSADDQAVTLRVTEDRHCGLAAPSAWNGDTQADSPSLAVHESFATDLLNAVFRGQNWPRDMDANGLQSFNDQLPVPLFESREFLANTRLHVRLNARRPFDVRFTDDIIRLVLRADRLELDEQPLLEARLELVFRLSAEGHKLVMRREGPPRLRLGDDSSIAAEVIERFETACRDELLGAMKTEVAIPAVIETEDWTIRTDRLDARSGWFTLFAQFGGK